MKPFAVKMDKLCGFLLVNLNMCPIGSQVNPADGNIASMLQDRTSSLWSLMLREAKLTLNKSKQQAEGLVCDPGHSSDPGNSSDSDYSSDPAGQPQC